MDTPFPQKLQKLIAKFEADRAHYLSRGYGEAQARIDFVTPLFKALGWDVENEAGLAHHAREVLVETSEAETLGKPDYSFRFHGQTKFFVEAKAPSEPLDAARHILQAKGYAWNTRQVFFVILTDFEEFRFYDASIQPDERKPDEGLLLKLKYNEYEKSIEKLWEFSKKRVAAGSLDALLPRDRRTQRLRIPVDEAFLDEMTGWREDLARNVFKNNPEITAKQLNEVVQRLLDRIVFIRIAEDRRIIENYQLRRAVEEWQARGGKFHIFDWLNDLFHQINEDFNGEIFKPHLSEQIKIDSEVLAKIIERLYPPRSPYRFDVIGVELLGSIYERYLGKTVRPTAKTVRVEEKPEVRKAGGVYYTPKYIVDYIVKNTVGKVIEGKTPKQIERVRILDPACGSGSFLIGAFQYLTDYHVRYLTEHPKEAHVHPLFPDLIRGENGEPRLSVVRKARILRNNLFGIDIDPQAVEITMMSLYLKALEGERSQLPPKHALLPELKYNIVCGNSLIGPDIFEQGTLFGDEERERINAFDWFAVAPVYDRRPAPVILSPDAFGRGEESAVHPPSVILSASEESAVNKSHEQLQTLRPDQIGTQGDKPQAVGAHGMRPGRTPSAPTIPDIMRAGGFDCVIGNPPYGGALVGGEEEYLRRRFHTATRNLDTYALFMEKAIRVCRPGGRVGMIVPTGWYSGSKFSALRRYVGSATDPQSFVNLPYDVFHAWVDTTVFIIAKRVKPVSWPRKERCVVALKTFPKRHAIESASEFDERVEYAELIEWFSEKADEFLTYASSRQHAIIRKIRNVGKPLGEFADIQRGVTPFELTATRKHKSSVRAFEGTVRRYFVDPGPRRYVRFDESLAEPKPEKYFKGPRLLLRELISRQFRLQAVRVKEDFVTNKSMQSFIPIAGGPDLNFLLGCLNSRLMSWYFLHRSNIAQRDDFPKIVLKESRALPIPPINFSDRADKARHDKMVGLVERMLELHRRGGSRAALGASRRAPTVAAMSSSSPVGGEDAAATELDREIAATDAAIDDLVYELYGITDGERKIIEGAL